MSVYTKAKLITIDGPCGVGKGTASRGLADYLGWDFLDSGALYRLCAYAAEEKSIAMDDVPALVKIAHHLHVRFSLETNKDDPPIWLDGIEVNEFIRTENCGNAASKIARLPAVREALLARQRSFLTEKGLVADGRDMGTVVFTEAPLKIYLTASAKIRAERRQKQLEALGKIVAFDLVYEEIKQRDDRDQKRAISPLKAAEDAVLVDTTDLNISAVLDRLIALANPVFNG